jgi:hypothetical protein
VRHFLLIYNHLDRKLVSQSEFDSDNSEAATTAYQNAEREYQDVSDVEIVLVGADSIETIVRTHGHYFSGKSGIDRYLSPVAG